MDYGPSDSSGTDDDLPSTYNRGTRGGQISGNGRTAVSGGLPYSRVLNDMETQIHWLEQQAYSAVLRAFKAQSDAITWEKEGLITELRKELRVSDDEHRELRSTVDADDTIRRIREWREAGGIHSGFLNNVHPLRDSLQSPTVSASRKKQKTTQPVSSFDSLVPPSVLAGQTGAPPIGAWGKKSKSILPATTPRINLQYLSASPTVRDQVAAAEPAKAAPIDPLVGRKVMTRWPEDNNFYEAVITDYNPAEGRHALVYDISTKDETWEWVNLKEISPDDIHWVDKPPDVAYRAGRGGLGRGSRKSAGRGSAISGVGRGRGSFKNLPKADFPRLGNGIGKNGPDEVEILSTDSLIKEVERVFSSNNSDPSELERAKKALKDHEQSLIDIIARLADASDGESEEGQRPLPHGQPTDEGTEMRNQENAHQEHRDRMIIEAGEGADRDRMVEDQADAHLV